VVASGLLPLMAISDETKTRRYRVSVLTVCHQIL
jgi:hypothetical protein